MSPHRRRADGIRGIVSLEPRADSDPAPVTEAPVS
jgi:hypothetical protein